MECRTTRRACSRGFGQQTVRLQNFYGVGDGCQSTTGVAVCSTAWIIQPSTRLPLTVAKTWTQVTPFTSCKSFGMIVTDEPLASVTRTNPRGWSRMKAPPPSEARMIAMIGVGSAVIVAVDVAGVVGSGVSVGVSVETPITAVACMGFGEGVIEATGAEVDVAGGAVADCGVDETRLAPMI